MNYLKGLGFQVATIYENDGAATHAQYGIPNDMASCHTVIIEDAGYFVEGHVPIAAIDKLLEEKPEIDGIALPGMPAGSPGMSGELEAPLKIYAVTNGKAEVFPPVDSNREG